MDNLSLLRTLVEQQQYPELKQACQEALYAFSEPALLPLYALALGYLGEREVAESYLRQALVLKAHLDADALADLAAGHMALRQLDAAVALLQSLLEHHPDHALALARLGWCMMAQGNREAAKALFSRSVELEPQRVAVFTNLASIYLQLDAPVAAQQVIVQGWQALEQASDYLLERVVSDHRFRLEELQLQLWVCQQKYAEAEAWINSKQLVCEEDEYALWISSYTAALAERDRHSLADEVLRDGLKNYPQNTTLLAKLADLVQLQGQFLPALHLLRRALKQDEDNIALWVQLSSACLHRFDQQARHAAEKALALAEALIEDDAHPVAMIQMQRAQAKNALAQIESHEQHFDLSERLFREILAEHRHFLPALQGLGQQLMQQGQIDEALALFERVKQIDPIRGHSMLINARRFPEDIEILEKMEKAAQTPSMEGSLKAGILFHLASAREKRQDYDKAFEFAQQANDASKKFLSYDAVAHRNQCARLRHAFSKALYQHRSDCGVDSTLPVYVLGMPRSGTTLVEQILSGHTDIFGAGELGVIPQVAQGLGRWERHTGSGRNYPDCIDDLTPYTTAGIANNVLTELQQLAADDKPEAKHVVDKLPHNFENIGLIKFLFPNAKIISVRRDPRDIALSNYFTDYQAKHGGMGFAYDLETIGEQLADHNMLMDHWHQTFPDEILELNYEGVVDDLEGSARKMLDYIGVNWQPQVLKFNELERTVKTASVWQVRQPIYKTSKAKWMRYEKYLAPLIKGTNAKINPDPIEDMISLPVPGFLTDGVALYKAGDLDGAELSLKKMLHHNPEHAACNYMLGLIYLSKHYIDDGIMQLEKALAKAPWHKEWRNNLIKAYQQAGEDEKAEALQAGPAVSSQRDDDFERPDCL